MMPAIQERKKPTSFIRSFAKGGLNGDITKGDSIFPSELDNEGED